MFKARSADIITRLSILFIGVEISSQVLEQAQQFYKRHDNKLILIITVLLVLYLISVIAKFAWQLFPAKQSMSVSDTSVSTAVERSDNAGSMITNLDSLLRLDLFGAIDEAPEEPVSEEITDAPETRLNLVLHGVVPSSVKNLGTAIIAHRNSQATYSIGEQIKDTNVTLEQIYSDRVIIKNRAVRETLMLQGVKFDEANRQREQQARRASQNRSPQIEPREVKRQILSEPESFTDFIRMSPMQDETGLIGYRLTAGNRYPDFFSSLGLENGDIATEVNGLDLTNPQQALEAVSLLETEETLNIELIRDEVMISISIDVPKE